MLYKERARGMVSDDIQMTFTVNRAAWIGDDLSGSLPHSTLRSVFSNKNMTFLLSVSDCWCRRWLSTWVWITRFGGLVRAAVRRWWRWWWRHNCRHKSQKSRRKSWNRHPPWSKKGVFRSRERASDGGITQYIMSNESPKSLKTRNKMVEMLWTCWLYDAKSLINIEKCCKWRKISPFPHKKNTRDTLYTIRE